MLPVGDDLFGIGRSAVVVPVPSSSSGFDADYVRELAWSLRRAFQAATLESPTFQNFPAGACTNACRLLSQYLLDHGVGGWEIVSARRQRSDGCDESHAWLVNGKWLLDITADQFDLALPAVISAPWTESAWHRGWPSPSYPYVSRLDHYSVEADSYRRDYTRLLPVAAARLDSSS